MAVQMLTATNYDLQQAMNLHLERMNEPAESNDISPEDEVAGELNIFNIESLLATWLIGDDSKCIG